MTVQRFKLLLRNRVVKNAEWIMAGKIIQMLVNVVVGLITARYLGPSNYGLINYAAAYTAFFSSICTLGINSVLVKEFVDAPEDEGIIIGTTLSLKSISSLLSAITIMGISIVVDDGETTTQLVVALSSIGVVFQIFETFHYWFQAKLQSKTAVAATLIAYTITSAYKIILLIKQSSVIYFAFATSVDYICLAVILIFCYKYYGGRKLTFSKQYAVSLLKKSSHFILPGLMVAIYGQTDKMMLKHMISDAEIGYYSTATSICNMWCFVLSAIIDSMYPPIMEAYKNSPKDFEKKNKLLYAMVFYIAVAASLFFTVFGGVVVRIMYGQEYLPAVAPLRVVTWYTAFSYLGVARNAWIVCMNRQKYLKYIYAASAAVNVVLNLLLIPSMGASGAAVASLIAQISTIVVPIFIKEMRENVVLMGKAILFR